MRQRQPSVAKVAGEARVVITPTATPRTLIAFKVDGNRISLPPVDTITVKIITITETDKIYLALL